MIFQRETKNKLSVAAIFATGWFAFVLLAGMAGIDVDFTGSDLMLVWICYFTFISVIASIFLMQPKWFVQQFRVYLLIGVVGVGIVGAIKLYLYYGDIVQNTILALAFAIIGFLFAKFFEDRGKEQPYR